MRVLVSVLIVLALLVSVVSDPAYAGWKEKRDAKEEARKQKVDSKALCYIFIPWPWREACRCDKDTDGDGVLDRMDKCPGTPQGAVVDDNGCCMDTDRDGVLDGLDKCPKTPLGAKVDEKGCCLDTDMDGVPDGIDKCADTPKGAKIDKKGCPMDSDGDGIFDGIDKCPNTPEGAEIDETGCTVEVKKFVNTGMLSSTKILFETSKAELKSECEAELVKIGGILVQVPDLKIEVAGHTDATGSEEFNEKLSQERANAVMEYLVEKFSELDAENFTAKGYGESKPVADNETADGRAKNRRVEFVIHE